MTNNYDDMKRSEDPALEQLIADSLDQLEAIERERRAIAAAQDVEFENLLADRTAEILAQTKGIPPALLPYIEGDWQYRGDRERDIRALKEGKGPDNFSVNAPGLAPIYFEIERELDKPLPAKPAGYFDAGAPAEPTGRFVVDRIIVDRQLFYAWPEAIAAAREHHLYLEERRRAERATETSLYNAAMRAPSVADRLLSLIEEIIEIAISERGRTA